MSASIVMSATKKVASTQIRNMRVNMRDMAMWRRQQKLEMPTEATHCQDPLFSMIYYPHTFMTLSIIAIKSINKLGWVINLLMVLKPKGD